MSSPGRPLLRRKTVKVNGREFTLPAGFTIELAVKPGLIDRPITIDLDEEGRLYVAESSGSNDPVKAATRRPTAPHPASGRHATATASSTGAPSSPTSMMFPEGTLWYDGSLYVAAPPSIWKLTDTDGDGIADQREEWFQGKTLTGCANDLHGPYLGPDGWIYWCKGAFAKQTYERPRQDRFVTRAAHIFRARPDGSGIEPVMTGGMDNPVDVAFTPGGERIFTTTFFQHPAGGSATASSTPSTAASTARTTTSSTTTRLDRPDLMPVMTHLGPAAPCGLHRYESARFGAEYQDNLFACSVQHAQGRRATSSTPTGATFTTRDEDFLVVATVWISTRPTSSRTPTAACSSSIPAAGTSCAARRRSWPSPTSSARSIASAEAVRPRSNDPRGKNIAWGKLTGKSLAELLGDDSAIRRPPGAACTGQGGKEVLADLENLLKRGKSPATRRNVVWAATRIDDLAAGESCGGHWVMPMRVCDRRRSTR